MKLRFNDKTILIDDKYAPICDWLNRSFEITQTQPVFDDIVNELKTWDIPYKIEVELWKD